ncbi:MAG TPA: AAA family ATPase, partial [Rhodocyclaceae bacterium]|nr:AAA family ATPase [Rhodocyclaceae bacterium]
IRAEEALAQAQERLHALQISAPAAEAELRSARDAMQSAHRRLTETRARHQALQQLQAKVAQRGEIGDWLKAHQLGQAMPLWRSIQVEAGWETAVEAVLRERFAALAAPVGVLRTALTHAPPSILTLTLADRAAANTPTSPDPRALRHKVACSDPLWSAALDEWLRDVYAVDDLYESLLHELPHGGLSYVARSGHLLTAVGLTLYVPDAKTHGVIERQREIDELALRLEAEEEAEDQAREHFHAGERHVNEQQSQLAAARRNAQQTQQSFHSAEVEALKLTQAQARFEERSTQIDRDQDELRRQEDSETTRREQAELQIDIQRERLSETRLRMDQATHAQRIKEDALREARSQESRLAREAQEAAFSERECLSKLEDTTRATATATQQLERIRSELASIRSELAGIDDHLLQSRLHEALDRKQARESALAGRRNDLESAASALRALDEQRLTLELRVAPLRERINELKLKAQAAQLATEQHQERLTELHIVTVDDEAEFAAELSANSAAPLKDNQLQGEIARLNREIDALGPVNLAALDELTLATERKGFLDEQSNDLNQAIATLEDAIRRIDRETREQLQTTYDSVNSHFGALFPQLFGGGEARLILTGDEILDAGIQIMAQPPGKKNSTIHLLSGGEKALTAIALVFALFQLNPAPFCMLDEVDAPLDDSNTIRFCNMVERMSTNTQFIFISHSKITMEMAQQLIGVTMQEQGVSRVVEVDIDEAMRMVDSSREAA